MLSPFSDRSCQIFFWICLLSRLFFHNQKLCKFENGVESKEIISSIFTASQ
jgi:hypothetical protein